MFSRLCLLKSLPVEIAKILEDETRLKVGVGVDGDVKRLLEEYSVSTNSWVDLRHLAVQFRPQQRKLGLAALTKEFLGVVLDDHWTIKASNWEAEQLTNRQLLMAANDALSALGSLMAMAMESIQTANAENRSKSKADKVPDYRDITKAGFNLCQPFIEQIFREVPPIKTSSISKSKLS